MTLHSVPGNPILSRKTTEELDERLRVFDVLYTLMEETGRKSFDEMTDGIEQAILRNVFPNGYDIFDPWDDRTAVARERMKRSS